MFIHRFIGNNNTVLSLETELKDSGLSHAVLIFGKEGCGANYFARLLAADIVAADENGLKLIEQDAHGQVQRVKGSGASGQIKVESVRAINDNVNFSSIGGEKRVVIIENCENFNLSSANALLKNLEEPKDDITYILTATDPSRILSTIRSRCQIFSLVQPSKMEAREYFARENHLDKDTLLKVYSGNIGKIKDCISSPKRLDILKNAINAQKLIESGELYEISRLLYGFNRKKDELVLFFKDLEYICDAELSRTNINILNAVTSAKNALSRNANPTLVMANFVVEAGN